MTLEKVTKGVSPDREERDLKTSVPRNANMQSFGRKTRKEPKRLRRSDINKEK